MNMIVNQELLNSKSLSSVVQIKAVYRRDQRFWARRPLTADMVVYAAADVLALVPNIYLAMKRLVQSKLHQSSINCRKVSLWLFYAQDSGRPDN